MADTETKVTKRDAKKRMVRALFSYAPENVDELQLKVNDILEVIEETEEGWWKGILEGKVGMFPSNFVIELDGHPEEFNNHLMNELSPTKNVIKTKIVGHQEQVHKHDSNHSPSGKQDVKPANLNTEDGVDGLSISKRATDSDDKKTVVSNKKPPVDSSAPRLPPKPVREQARVMFPYVAQNEDELSLKEGDIITVISKEIEDKGWWKGELNNRIGVFPDNFVQLLKVDEQKKPERPDKPSIAISAKASLKSNASEKNSAESSPKLDKKVMKTPPMKPPPPEILKKDVERPFPPYPSKKPQLPHPMKKPMRSSLGGKHQGFPLPTATNSPKSPVSENNPPINLPVSTSEAKCEDPPKSEKTVEKPEETQDKKDDLGFDAVESSGKKLVHLTANRAKVPNRRPPSHIFLKENDKENGLTDSRRLSEPLLSEIKSLLPLGDAEIQKVNVLSSEIKPKIPPSRPSPPNIKSGSVGMLSKSFVSNEESSIKSLESKKRNSLASSSVALSENEIAPKALEVTTTSSTTSQSFEIELNNLKDNMKIVMSTMINRIDYHDLLKQVKELKETMENYNENCNKAISNLKQELEEERKLRQAVEMELQQLKNRQTT